MHKFVRPVAPVIHFGILDCTILGEIEKSALPSLNQKPDNAGTVENYRDKR